VLRKDEGRVATGAFHLNSCGENRAWRSFDWDALNRLNERGLIGDPVNRAKSAWLTEEGLGEAERLFTKYFVRPGV
jgi:hypothetical protein